MIKFLDLSAQYLRIKDDIDAAIATTLETASFIGGKANARFESEFSAAHDTRFGIGVANGTDAIEIILEALDFPKGSEIIVPANSFIASSEAVTRQGYSVVFCDCNPDNYTLSLESLTAKLTPKTKAVIAVHLYGHPCDMDALQALATQHQFAIIEDCAQAHLATYKGRKVGSFGIASAFSFYPGKNLGAYGDAGMILSNDEATAKRCRMIANHGRIDKYNHEFEGRNSRLDGLQAAILNAKLPHLSTWTCQRQTQAKRYLATLSPSPTLALPQEATWAGAVYHLFVIRTPHRDALKAFLAEQRIETGIHYPIALPKLHAYAYCNQASEPFFAHQSDTQLLSLPIGDHLTDADIDEVCTAVKMFFANAH